MQTIETLMAEVAFLRETCAGQREDLAARDQTIADLRELVECKRAEISELRRDIRARFR